MAIKKIPIRASFGSTDKKLKAEIENHFVDHSIESEVVDKLYRSFEESGSVVTCNPDEGSPLEVVSTITPAQSGNGDPDPENIRPISGYTSATLTCCGKNLINPIEYVTSGNSNNTTLDGDVFTTDFTSSALFVNYYWQRKQKTLPKGTYTVTFIPVSVGACASVYVYAADDNALIVTKLDLREGNTSFTFTANEEFFVSIGGPTKANHGTHSYKLQLEIGTTATAYEPYQGDTFTGLYI